MTVQPPLESQRVLGQIERGEVLAGPEGARRIAARHQTAYGNTVWGPTPKAVEPADDVWADALASLNGDTK